MAMQILIDAYIPYIQGIVEQLPFSQGVKVSYLSPEEFTPQAVRKADALLIRTRTRCDAALLHGSQVRFIATATVGFDHLDTAYLDERGISWTNAPGCNANSVAEYVEAALYLLDDRKSQLPARTLGVIGVGHVGGRVARQAEKTGYRVLRCDPPRMANSLCVADPSHTVSEGGAIAEEVTIETFVSLQEVIEQADIITFHVPLTREGTHPTYHLADEAFFAAVKRAGRAPIIINTARGEVVDNAALLHALEEGVVSEAILDVWESEPRLNTNLLDRTFLGTPHIAGYSADGKANATRMVVEALCCFYQLPIMPQFIAPPSPDNVSTFPSFGSRAEQLLHAYNPLRDSTILKANSADFEQFRTNYPLRRELNAYFALSLTRSL